MYFELNTPNITHAVIHKVEMKIPSHVWNLTNTLYLFHNVSSLNDNTMKHFERQLNTIYKSVQVTVYHNLYIVKLYCYFCKYLEEFVILCKRILSSITVSFFVQSFVAFK